MILTTSLSSTIREVFGKDIKKLFSDVNLKLDKSVFTKFYNTYILTRETTKTENNNPDQYRNNYDAAEIRELKTLSSINLESSGNLCYLTTLISHKKFNSGPIIQIAYTDSGTIHSRLGLYNSWGNWTEIQSDTSKSFIKLRELNSYNNSQLNLLSLSNLEVGKFITESSGNLVSDVSKVLSSKIPCIPNSEYVIVPDNIHNFTRVTFHTKDGTFISGLKAPDTADPYPIITPINAAYLESRILSK